MRIETLQATLLDFANNPAKSWGASTDGKELLNGFEASVSVEQSDRNTARILSGTYNDFQLLCFNHACEAVETRSGTAVFDPHIPETLEFSHACQGCGTTFASSLADVMRCYDCELKLLCPLLPGRQISHWWHHDVWTLQVHGDVGFHNEITYWWSHKNTGSNVGHQGLVAHRTPDGTITRLVFTTASQSANKRYRMVFDFKSDTVVYSIANRASVHDDAYTPPSEYVDNFEPLVMDLIMAMLPPFVVYTHRPRDPRNGRFVS